MKTADDKLHLGLAGTKGLIDSVKSVGTRHYAQTVLAWPDQAIAGLDERRKPDQIPPMIRPAIRCQSPHHAAINAIPPTAMSGGKIFGLNNNRRAKPEF